MPCASCSVQFGVFKRKKQCHECRCYFCNLCLRIKRDRILCSKCLVLTARPLSRSQLLQLKSKDLVIYLKSLHVSTSGCVEKEDLVNLLITHVNSDQFRENVHHVPNNHGARSPPHRGQQMGQSSSATAQNEGNGTGSSNPFRQFNFQNLWASVQEKYDNVRCRPNAEPQQPQPRRVYTRVRPPYHQTHNPPPGERVRTESAPQPETRRPSLLDTQDCVEIEDIGDWEFLSRTGEPLSDSDPAIIVEVTPPPVAPPTSSLRRTTSDIDVQSTNIPEANSTQARRHSIHNVGSPVEDPDRPGDMFIIDRPDFEVNVDMNISQDSLRDLDEDVQQDLDVETEDVQTEDVRESSTVKDHVERRINLVDIAHRSDLEDLSVKQLKELLVANRVDFKGCCEKNELLERVHRLWKEYAQNREKLDDLPMDDLCKICMDAPVECVMLECGHLATCTDCGKQLSECPICRQYVVRVVRTFRA